MIFCVIAIALLLAEITVWWLTSPLRKQDSFHTHLEHYSRRIASGHLHRPKHTSFPGLATSKSAFSHFLKCIERGMMRLTLLIIRLMPIECKKQKLAAAEKHIREHFETLQNLTTRNWLQRLFFTPVECFNMVWACYLIFAQTIGAFNNCACMSSIWGGLGGYLDFTQFNVADSPLVLEYWIQGTVITCVAMGLGMGYIILEVRCIKPQTNLSIKQCHSGSCKHISVLKIIRTRWQV